MIKVLLLLILFLLVSGCNKFSINETSEPGIGGASAPTSLEIQLPTIATGISDRPTIRIHGVSSSQTVKLFSSSHCASASLVGVVVASGTSVDIQIDSSSALNDGIHHFYATADDSACSTASLTYEKVTCPSEYVFVPRNASLGTGNFCLMKYEAKNVAGVPTSQPGDLPWVNITDQSALDECQSLNSMGSTHYDLISNAEWVAAARDIESNPLNFDSGVLFIGHSDNDPSGTIEVTDEFNPWSDTNNTSSNGLSQKRVLILSNGEQIWDFSGNAWEVVDWVVETPNTSITVPVTSCNVGWNEFSVARASCSDLTLDQLGPLNLSMNSSNGIGKIIASPSTTGALRGGTYSHYGNDYNGIYALHLSHNAYSGSSDTSFRCVYRF